MVLGPEAASSLWSTNGFTFLSLQYLANNEYHEYIKASMLKNFDGYFKCQRLSLSFIASMRLKQEIARIKDVEKKTLILISYRFKNFGSVSVFGQLLMSSKSDIIEKLQD